MCVKEMMNGTGRRIDGTQYTYTHTTVVEGHPLQFSLHFFLFKEVKFAILRKYSA